MYDSTDPVPHWTVATMRHVATEGTLAGAAVRYANLGIPVFPCVPGGKQPLTPSGFHDATSSARVVHQWWQRTPEANIGLPTGARTGILVVDIDVHSGASGFGAFERARAEGLAEGWGWAVRTPSGGIHAYYPTVPGQEQRCWQVPSAHVDFRGDGGYVIAPPSQLEVNGMVRTYDVIAVSTKPARPVDATKLRAFLEPPRRNPSPAAPSAAATGCRPDALAATVAAAPEGGRNRSLFWASCRMVENGLDRTTVAGYLTPAAQHAGLPDREIKSTIDSAFRSTSRLGAASRPGPTPASEAIQL
ncbi:bifunctional DNA primase/polymerase [Nocardioides sp. W7]|uniref:bifunctional DNA primase/polymerase n=1 Tax=Nocardioides sp. W7 TaxID=2931390 RepID=UPI001FD30E54|nr:bifunctional DNA primase/polymerase [Nocardioides sp. W7]